MQGVKDLWKLSISPGKRRYRSTQVVEINPSWFAQFAMLPGVIEKIRFVVLQEPALDSSDAMRPLPWPPAVHRGYDAAACGESYCG